MTLMLKNIASDKELGAFLTKNHNISNEQYEQVLRTSLTANSSISTTLEVMGILDEDTILKALSEFSKYPLLNRNNLDERVDRDSKIKNNFLISHKIIPLQTLTNKPAFSISDPFNHEAINAIRFLLGSDIDIFISSSRDIEHIIAKYFNGKNISSNAEQAYNIEDVETLKSLAAEQPVIKFVNTLIEHAVDQGASDIHVEGIQNGLSDIRIRIDGELTTYNDQTHIKAAAIISRLKLLSELNIAERRLPQDGRTRMTVRGRKVDFRVATSPSYHGESLVLRILDRSAVELNFKNLGYEEEGLSHFTEMLTQPNGIVLVTGPTGSGKTTTLYTAIKQLNDGKRKIITIEDPVEYELNGITQISVQPNIGFTFARGLRSILRQDPDIILIGEIRDLETAEIAIQAALTGHLVLATLHTNSCAGTITRLLDMGVQPFLVSSTLNGIVAQRLVKKLCNECKTADHSALTIIKGLYSHIKITGNYTPMKANGCEHCNQSGYNGRTSVYEMMPINKSVKDIILKSASEENIAHQAKVGGFTPLVENALAKVLSGQIALDDALKTIKQ